MFTVRKSDERGETGSHWLDSKHSFSFADYYDPKNMGFGPLRVINEDWVAPASGFGMHPHRNMEIITYVLEGAISHEDSLGSKGKISPGEVQVMSAGAGILHSEFNHAPHDPVHLLQIWIMPNKHNTAPGYQQQAFDRAAMQDRFHTIVSGQGDAGALAIQQDATLKTALIGAGKAAGFTTDAGRKYWLQVARGEATVASHALAQGDALAIENEAGDFNVTADTDAEVLLFDLPR